VRFPRRRVNHDVAASNCRTLFHAASAAGVDRIVHLSIRATEQHRLAAQTTPPFAVGGTGSYRVRPIHVEDLARLCVAAGASGRATNADTLGIHYANEINRHFR
jgi:hypothetical protein